MTDWATDFNHYTDEYAANAFAVWDELRERCPVAHSEAFRGMWVPTRHEDIVAIAHDTDTFSSRSPLVAQYGSMADFGIVVPPISSDPPYHTEIRRMLLPFFAPGRIEKLRAGVEEHCDELLNDLLERGECDAATDYAQYIPVRVIATMLGIPPEDGDTFRTWVVQLLEAAPTNIEVAGFHLFELFQYFGTHIERMRENPGDDLISFLVAEAHDVIGRDLQQDELFGMCLLLLLAGIDTTWSSIGASLWHLASHPEDQQRLRDDPSLWPVAIEELLRAYAPVTMAREVARDTEFRGCPMRKGDPLLLPFPSANRDPAAFDRAGEVVIDRAENRHLAFGVGIHRCLGSNLARLEVHVAVEKFVNRVGPFRLSDPDAVRWAKGQVRGPRVLPVVFEK